MRAEWPDWREPKVTLKRSTDYLRALRVFRSSMNWFDGSPAAIIDRLRRLRSDQDTPYYFVDWNFGGSFGSNSLVNTALDYFKLEMERRHCLIAVAIKEYQLINQKWPSEFADLKDVGITEEIWKTIGHYGFSMDHRDDGINLLMTFSNLLPPATGRNANEGIRIR